MKHQRTNRAVIVAVLVLFVFLVSALAATAAPAKQQIKNVIVFVGDGMGDQQRRIAGIVEGNGNAGHRLMMESFPAAGIATNHCLDKLVTDSAASGTALACGQKTNYGMVGVCPDGKKMQSILELCKSQGKSTGLITTVTITHATPASFGSHVANRKMEETIAVQYLQTGIDLLLGGGVVDFLPEPAGKRKDGKDLLAAFKKAGYTYVTDRNSLLNVNTQKTKKLLGLFSKGDMAYEIDRNAEKEPHIAEMTETALNMLGKNPKGFFLMVEGGKIDWACHGHDVPGAVYDTIALDKAVKSAVSFAKKNPETLIVVVNDHETGGMAITARVSISTIRKLKATAERMVSKIKKDGSNIDEVFLTYAGINNLTAPERKMVTDEVTGKSKIDDEWGYGGSVIANIISKRTGIYFNTGGHTGAPVIVAAYGPGSQIFNGYYDQSEIPRKIARLLGAELK